MQQHWGPLLCKHCWSLYSEVTTGASGLFVWAWDVSPYMSRSHVKSVSCQNVPELLMWCEFLIGGKQYQVNINIFRFLLHDSTPRGSGWPEPLMIFGVKVLQASWQNPNPALRQSYSLLACFFLLFKKMFTTQCLNTERHVKYKCGHLLLILCTWNNAILHDCVTSTDVV